MNLSCRGFLASLVAVAVGAKAIARGEPIPQSTLRPAQNVRVAVPGDSPYSIPAFINERPSEWRFVRDHLAWSNEEITMDGRLADGWKPTEAHKGPRHKMRKAPRDGAYWQRGGRVETINTWYGSLNGMHNRKVWRDILERSDRELWAVPNPKQMEHA